ncbi:PREDICTED: interferon-induced transmembrane protein 1-like [Nanorana parkeri]|uniref:interferon-induced transmembrane protein 1-like n=1 Tax=Nanorana parkeri TaxID=125878 RepID=UPI000854BD13|nr:PREDICTED: interferon-induced transmembrane protein 1-like [Nanorana parkeri]
MDAEKKMDSSNPGEGVYVNQVNLGYDPHREVPAYSAPSYPATTTVVTIVEDNSLISDHIVWSIFSTLYMNCCCLGFFALLYSVKSRDRKLMGDRVSAKAYGNKARTLNITTTVITSLYILLMIILMASGILTLRYYNAPT